MLSPAATTSVATCSACASPAASRSCAEKIFVALAKMPGAVRRLAPPVATRRVVSRSSEERPAQRERASMGDSVTIKVAAS